MTDVQDPTKVSTVTLSAKAPSDLPGGYLLDVETGGVQALVAVPDGGVAAGSTFEGIVVEAPTIPRGAWRDEFCGCCKYVGKCVFWNTLCCAGIAFGQLLERMGYDWKGDRVAHGQQSNACCVHTIVYLLLCAVAVLFGGFFGSFVYSIFMVYFIMKLRAFMKDRYQIPGGGPFPNCLLAFFCGCCTIHQMETHVNDYDKVNMDWTSNTGLEPNASKEI